MCDDASATSGTSPVSGVQWYSTPPIVSFVHACTYAASGVSFQLSRGEGQITAARTKRPARSSADRQRACAVRSRRYWITCGSRVSWVLRIMLSGSASFGFTWIR
jgi:hypothetical protein